MHADQSAGRSFLYTALIEGTSVATGTGCEDTTHKRVSMLHSVDLNV